MDLPREKPLSRLVVMVPEDVVAWLEMAAETRACSVSEVVCDLVTDHLFASHWKKIGEVARKAILAQKTNEEALAEVLKAFPKAATSTRSISWYRSNLRKEHADLPTDAELKRLRKSSKSR